MTNQEKIKEICEHWNEIESRIKEAEQIRGHVVMPAINELRYAGRKIVDAWLILEDSDIDCKKRQEEFDKTVSVIGQYLTNADHDVSDAVCLFIHAEINRYINKYSAKTITRHFVEFPKFVAEINEINKVISLSRRDRGKRVEKYIDISENHIPKLKKWYSDLQMSAELALSEEYRIAWYNKAYKVIALIGTVCSVAALILCV